MLEYQGWSSSSIWQACFIEAVTRRQSCTMGEYIITSKITGITKPWGVSKFSFKHAQNWTKQKEFLHILEEG